MGGWREAQPAVRAAHYNQTMPLLNSRRPKKNAPQIETGQEGLYLKSLSERQVPVAVKMRDGEVVTGWIEYFDDAMIRLTREGKPNLFIYKAQIRTIAEQKNLGAKRGGNRE